MHTSSKQRESMCLLVCERRPRSPASKKVCTLVSGTPGGANERQRRPEPPEGERREWRGHEWGGGVSEWEHRKAQKKKKSLVWACFSHSLVLLVDTRRGCGSSTSSSSNRCGTAVQARQYRRRRPPTRNHRPTRATGMHIIHLGRQYPKSRHVRAGMSRGTLTSRMLPGNDVPPTEQQYHRGSTA